ncbi:PTS beta-glucoside transporter subunit EIIBCA [Brachybacterium sp. SGAir0954]|uniref:glucose PTS transporter subunit IIA n=1 Tax=Brachybacterium sp. SGAir0954 TaxID=2571029 RepID=UPI0010CCBC59|nr:glucose PTS transporter subunit IIA [Brachybacterium sp. SGAir0954]QCR52458.1 PTS beta-glucoside transporter subunit EIIBCA [Brachybacterium sp. SGAir0954]
MNTPSSNTSEAEDIVRGVGGPANIESLTHCATRLRFQLHDAEQVDRTALDALPGVMGTVPQSGDRFQVVIGGAVAGVYSQIMNLPSMSGGPAPRPQSDAEVKAAIRAKGRGRFAWLDNVFEYLSDSFRPLMGVLLGASLIVAIVSALDAFGVIDYYADGKSATWVFVDAMWRSVLYFLPIMVAYNAAKKLQIDPWVGAAVMAAVMTPNYTGMLSGAGTIPGVTCTTNATLGTEQCTATVFGLPMQLNDYGGQVFVPLLMVALLALVYKGLAKIFPANVQLVFVPFFSMLVMIPVTAFLIGPLGIWAGNGIGAGLAWLNGNAPIVFAVVIPLLYPFLVPLGLHWPLNALMLQNINTLGYDFIQGPMGAWNFACFGATAGVLLLSLRHREPEMRQTATGALAAGLFGGISEPSLYGIHLRFKRIYPRMLVGCLVGGLIVGLLGGVDTSAFAFTSLLTIPVFDPIPVYVIAIAAAFVTAMVLVYFSDYMPREQRAAANAARDLREADERAAATAASESSGSATSTTSATTTAPVVGAATATTDGADAAAGTAGGAAPTATLLAEADLEIVSPVAGRVLDLDDAGDPVFASRALGEGVGVEPADGTVLAPLDGELITVAGTGHAFGIRGAGGVEVLVHVGIDTVQMNGEGFDVRVEAGQQVRAGDLLAEVDLGAIRAAGHPALTLVTVINTASLAEVRPLAVGEQVAAGAPVVAVRR